MLDPDKLFDFKKKNNHNLFGVLLPSQTFVNVYFQPSLVTENPPLAFMSSYVPPKVGACVPQFAVVAIAIAKACRSLRCCKLLHVLMQNANCVNAAVCIKSRTGV